MMDDIPKSPCCDADIGTVDIKYPEVRIGDGFIPSNTRTICFCAKCSYILKPSWIKTDKIWNIL